MTPIRQYWQRMALSLLCAVVGCVLVIVSPVAAGYAPVPESLDDVGSGAASSTEQLPFGGELPADGWAAQL